MMKKVKGRKFHQDNRGGAMAMVLIIIAFISLLASVLMFAAYGGYQMRIVDRQGTDNFYSAETVLDEINAGLQIEVSNALAKSYEQVMVNYALYETAEKRSEAFYNVYFEELKKALQMDAANPNQYSITKLRGYLTSDVLGDGRPADGLAADGSRTNFGNYGAIVESNVSPETYTLILQNNGILLKDLKVSYVNQRGYVSIISTDIRIVLPAANFSQTSAFPGLNDYCLIADQTLTMGNTFAGGEIELKGNAYAGNMILGKKEDGSMLSSKIKFKRADGADPNSLSVVVSRGDIEIAESTITTENIELWGENLVLNSSEADLQGSTNLKDDLVLDGNGSKAAIAGEYAGFGNAEDSAALSSAIVVNGKDSYLDLSGLTSMNISGRSYVATAAEESETDEEIIQQNTTDIAMGESVAVKSNQLIYLVPPEALGCIINDDGSTGESKYGCNPLKYDQYVELVDTNPDKYVLLDGHKQIAALGYKSLDNYIKQEMVAGENGTTKEAYVPEIIFKKTYEEPLVYCYMRFKDEKAANQYFADYYNVNASKVDAYTKLYAKEIKLGDTNALLYLNLAGNMLSYSESTGGALVGATDSSYEHEKAANVISLTKSDIFKALSAKMVTNIAQLSANEQGQTAFANIIYRTKLEEIINKFDTFGTESIQINTEAAVPADIKSTILSKGDYTIDSGTPDSVQMVISLGNVTVKRDFKGLIISAKNIIVEDSQDIDHKVCIEPLTLEDFTELLNAKKSDGTDEYYVLDVFKDGKNYADSGSVVKDMGTETVSMSDLIIYERWSKR